MNWEPIINSENFAEINFSENYFKFREFEDFSTDLESGTSHIDSDFHDCTFRRVEWYWGLFNIATFVRCEFTDCIFRGSSFPDCLFVECTLTNCQFVKDNLGGDCTFEGAVSYGCKVENTVGFAVTVA